MRELLSVFDPLPPQRAFLKSPARIRAYGGAMGGGKSRTGCEAIFDASLDYPGLVSLVARSAHTSIIGTTKKTMLQQVIPADVIARKKESGGEDWVELFNGSVIHFIGLDDPLRWYSSEIGYLFFDEAQEIKEETVIRLNTRLRQAGMPNRMVLTFNPSNPNHWLKKWFIDGATQTDFGFRRDELWLPDALASAGTCEFFFAKATDNHHLPEGYVESTLGGMPERLRRRYLEGLWENIEGNAFFDGDSLAYYQRLARETKPVLTGRLEGDPAEDFRARQRGGKPQNPCTVRSGDGPLVVYQSPVRDKRGDHGLEPGHRYVMAIDSSSGGSYDYSAIQVVDVKTFEQVAEWQGKMTPAQVGLEAYRLGRIYNNAVAVPELTGGWGFAVQQELQRLRYPSIYTRKVLDRLTKKWTDKLGWDTTTKSRQYMLDTLERVLREQEFGLYGLRSVLELGSFVFDKNNKPQAQDGENDDLVMALAIAVTVALELPKEIRRPVEKPHVPRFGATGY